MRALLFAFFVLTMGIAGGIAAAQDVHQRHSGGAVQRPVPHGTRGGNDAASTRSTSKAYPVKR